MSSSVAKGWRSKLLVVAAVCATVSSGVHAASSEPTLRQLVQRHEDVLEIQNLMSLRAYYHAAGAQDKEFDLYSKRSDITWGQNQGYRIGRDHIRAQYVENFQRQREKNLEKMSSLYPEVSNVPENLGVGSFVVHTLETPIIEVANDGKTAKGMWTTIAAMASTKADKSYGGSWELEKYGVDFIKEDGHWRFWHILVVTDFSVPMGKDLSAAAPVAAAVGAEGVQASSPRPTTLAHDVDAVVYTQWGPTVVPKIFPEPPVPYRTFSDTFSYGPAQTDIDRVLSSAGERKP